MSDSLTNLQNSVIRYINKERKRKEKIMSDIKTSIIRTVVPAIVGAIAAFLTGRGIELDPETVAAITTLLTVLFSAAYYATVRYFEQKFPKLGLLLGSAKTPEYK